MITCSPQEKIIDEFIKNDPVQKFTSPWFLCLFLPEWSTAVFLFSDVNASLSWTVKLSAVLQKNPSGFTNSLVFQHLLTLFNDDCMILRSIFSHEDNWGTRMQHSLMLQKEKPWIKSQGVKTCEQNEDMYIFLILPKYPILFI